MHRVRIYTNGWGQVVAECRCGFAMGHFTALEAQDTKREHLAKTD